MKKNLFIAMLLLMASTSFAQEPKLDIFVDPRDGKEYQTVKIGDQVWFAQNLAYKAKDGCWAYDNNKKNAKKYGYLYNFNTAQKACPDGWHVPSMSEWETFERAIGISEVEQTGSGNGYGNRKNKPGISFRIRAKEGWPKGLNGTNELGFNMLPGGESGSKCCFESLKQHAYFWSSNVNPSDSSIGIEWVFYDDGDIAVYRHSSIYYGRSVRCIQN